MLDESLQALRGVKRGSHILLDNYYNPTYNQVVFRTSLLQLGGEKSDNFTALALQHLV
jgi:hypothetical protein